jgi:excinuclease ABC subunit C
MEENKEDTKQKNELKKLPGTPGVYFFLGDKKRVLYIGKATSLKSRVRSYFDKDIREKRSELIERMVRDAKHIDFEKTDSVLEALLLEAELIRKYRPPYNTDGKDQKSFNFVVITDEDFPTIMLVRERTLFLSPETTLQGKKPLRVFGPFPHGAQIREALKIIRRIFPYRDNKCVPAKPHPLTTSPKERGNRPCFNRQIGLCPGVCTGEVSKADYRRTVRHLILFFEGKKKKLISVMQKEMKDLAKRREFESASQIKRQIEALSHINDIALLKREGGLEDSASEKLQKFRIEAYDIAHTSGKDMVGVMTVVEGGEAAKGEYRLFNIKGQSGADDLKALRETLTRRLKHTEWRYPDLIVVDGNENQINAAKSVLVATNIEIPVVSVVKDERHKARELLGGLITVQYKNEILLANSEAHRFAINFHRRKRGKSFI